MMDLTPLEVRKKKGDFKRQMRGYDPALVDDFLDLVADRLEQLVRENMNVGERIARLESQVTEYRDREKALTEALVSAQQMREEIRKQVEKEAQLARREAEADAENIRVSAVQAREREEEAIRRLRARQAQLVQSYRGFLERELAELGVMAETLEVTRNSAPAATGARPAAKSARATKSAAANAPAASAPAAAAANAPAAAANAPAVSASAAAPANASAASARAVVPAVAEVPQHLPPPGPPPEQMPVPLPEPVPTPQPSPVPHPMPEPVPTPAPQPMPTPTPQPVAPAAKKPTEDREQVRPLSVQSRTNLESEPEPLPLVVTPPAGLPEEFLQLPTLDPEQTLELTIEPAFLADRDDEPQMELEDAIEDIVEDDSDDEEDEGAWVSSLLERKGQ